MARQRHGADCAVSHRHVVAQVVVLGKQGDGQAGVSHQHPHRRTHYGSHLIAVIHPGSVTFLRSDGATPRLIIERVLIIHDVIVIAHDPFGVPGSGNRIAAGCRLRVYSVRQRSSIRFVVFSIIARCRWSIHVHGKVSIGATSFSCGSPVAPGPSTEQRRCLRFAECHSSPAVVLVVDSKKLSLLNVHARLNSLRGVRPM
mmetsp:Transcript_14376/g.39593  ORF Transcript_14376/g.39593 Transcript_14376/m.39593 type:complete len:200 (-) Transcript_14376:91-690(-)